MVTIFSLVCSAAVIITSVLFAPIISIIMNTVYIFFISAAVFGTNFAAPPGSSANPSVWKTLDGSRPKIYAHRGEKVLMPEHTIPAYEFASILGADFVEPDLCVTQDNQLVCFHDLELGSGTDVKDHPEFDHLKHNTSHGYDWYIRNFTLAELKTLKVVQKKA